MGASLTWPHYGQQSDPSDFLNATVTQNDAFAEFYTPGATDQFLTPVDLTQLILWGSRPSSPGRTGSAATSLTLQIGPPTPRPQFNDILITASGTYVVSSFQDETIDSLTMAAGATLDIGGGTFTIDNGTVSGTTSGTIDVAAGATLVLDGTFRNAGTINVLGGTIDLSGTISGTGMDEIGSGGTLIVASGGFADPTFIFSGGTEIISSGGSDVGALISGGEQDVFGLATGASVFGGSQVIKAGGAASGTIVSSGGTVVVNSGAKLTSGVVSSGGTEIVSAGGSDLGAKISGGEQDVFGLASGTTVLAGSQVIETGGTAINAIVKGGGTIVLDGGAKLTVATVSSGGVLELFAGATVSSATISSGGVLELLPGATSERRYHQIGRYSRSRARYHIVRLSAQCRRDCRRSFGRHRSQYHHCLGRHAGRSFRRSCRSDEDSCQPALKS